MVRAFSEKHNSARLVRRGLLCCSQLDAYHRAEKIHDVYGEGRQSNECCIVPRQSKFCFRSDSRLDLPNVIKSVLEPDANRQSLITVIKLKDAVDLDTRWN